MKKVTSLLLLTGVAAFGLVGCGDDVVTQPDDPQVLSVTVTPSSVSIEEGETVTLAANVEADDGADTGVTWSSSNSSVASVDGSGNVTGQSTGSATIVATSNADASKSGAAEVTVTEGGGERPTINIKGINCEDENECGVPGNITGEFRVEVNFDEGDQDISAVQLLLNGEVVREQTFSTNMTGLNAATEGTTDLVWLINSGAADECTEGQILEPNFSNGDYELQARLVLEEGADETATWDDSLTFDNGNRVDVVHIDGTGATVVGGGAEFNSDAPEGQRFWGHNFMGDGAVTDTLHFAACPVVFEGDDTVAEIRLAGKKVSPASEADDKDFFVDLGAGHGNLQSDDAEPFQYLARPAPNDSVEDTEGGHVVGGDASGEVADPMFIRIFNSEGEDITGQFTVNPVLDFWMDFTAPMPGDSDGDELVDPRIQIDTMDIAETPSRHYTDEAADYTLRDGTVLDGDPDGDGLVSDYNIVDVVDNGVGVVLDDQQTDVYHDTASDIGGASSPVAADVEGLNDTDGTGAFILDEQGPDTDPDWYVANVPELIDLLKNSMTTAGIAGLNSSPVHGLDRTEPEITPVDTIPEFKVIDDTVPFIIFSAVDPDLDNDADPADPGSGVDNRDCATTGTADCLAILAFDQDGDRLVVDDNTTDKSTNPDYRVNFGTAIDDDEGDTVSIDVTVPDSAIKAPNVATINYTFIFDTTPPTVSFGGITGLGASDADNVTQTLDGSVTDRNGDGTAVTEATLFVTVSTDDVCNNADDIDPDDRVPPAPVDPDTVSVLDQVQSSGDGSYTQDFVFENTGAASDTVKYCFNMQADDGAMSTDGSVMDPHIKVKSARKDFVWNP